MIILTESFYKTNAKEVVTKHLEKLALQRNFGFRVKRRYRYNDCNVLVYKNSLAKNGFITEKISLLTFILKGILTHSVLTMRTAKKMNGESTFIFKKCFV